MLSDTWEVDPEALWVKENYVKDLNPIKQLLGDVIFGIIWGDPKV